MENTTSGDNTAGKMFILNCTLSGVPESVNVVITWLRNVTVINTTSDGKITVSNSQLIFNPLQASQEGIFSCQVMIEGATDEKSFNITVNGTCIG